MNAAPIASDVPAERAGFLVRYRLWILLLITLAAGAARFATLDRPPIWGDEAFTYYRVSGEFREMLDILQFNGFPPLHYEAYWALGQATKLTPKVMRLIPATAGTLMVPAMYFLAVQIVRKRVALLVALFTCVSAYMMAYSHDAKMYMACWLFVTLHVGCLLWWLRVGRTAVGRIAWLAWVAYGVAAVGLHHSANMVLAMEPIILLSFPLVAMGSGVGRRLLLFLLGAIIILSAPAGYFLGFNRIEEKVDEQGFAYGSETMWVERYNLGRTPADLVLYTATAYLYSWEWPQYKIKIDEDVLHGLEAAAVALLLLISLGAMPWRRRWRTAAPADPEIAPLDHDPPVQSWWRQYLWISAWMVPFAYGLYCASTPHFLAPWEVLKSFASLFNGHWYAVIAEILILAILCKLRPGFARALTATVPIVAVLAFYAVLVNSGIMEPWSGQQNWSHYWPMFTEWWDWLTAPRFLMILVGILPVIAWHYSAGDVRSRALRLGQFLMVAIVLFIVCLGVWFYFHHRFGEMAKRMVTERQISLADAKDAVWKGWLSIWMPRYLGVAWPAFAIAVCVLLSRLPTRPVRYAAIVLLLGMNIAQATARLVAGTEPRSDLIAADIYASQEKHGDQLTHTETRAYLANLSDMTIGAPGSLSVFSHQTRYFLSQYIPPGQVKPRDFKWTPPSVVATLKTWGLRLWTESRAGAIVEDVKTAPQIRRIILWERLNTPQEPGVSADLPDRLGPEWKRAGQQLFIGRDHWTWNNLWTLRRSEFVRISPTTAP